MLILIEKDSATRIAKEVTEEQAAAFAEQFAVFVVCDDGSNKPYADWKAKPAQSGKKGDLTDEEKAAQARREAVEKSAFEKSGLTAAKWKKLAAAERDKLIQAELKD